MGIGAIFSSENQTDTNNNNIVDNTAIGCYTLHNNISENNTAVGANALFHNTYGENNTAIGAGCLIPVTYINKLTNQQDIGLIAHELQEVFPCLVSGEKDGEDIQSVNYTGLIPILIKEIRELKEQYDNLKEQYDNLEEKYNNLYKI